MAPGARLSIPRRGRRSTPPSRRAWQALCAEGRCGMRMRRVRRTQPNHYWTVWVDKIDTAEPAAYDTAVRQEHAVRGRDMVFPDGESARRTHWPGDFDSYARPRDPS